MGLPTKFRKAAIAANKTGGFHHQMDRHFACHFERGDTLVVTFDHMKARDMPAPRFPWGYNPLRELGASHLGIMMTRRNDWFRHRDLFDFFDRLQADGFFGKYRKVLFYGSSMGGFAACAFAAAAPGADVLALMPQSTLDPALAPAETRYAKGRDRGDWTDPRYRDAGAGITSAKRAYLLYDPYFGPDRAHADRLAGDKVRHLKCYFAGHKAGRLLHLSGFLSPLLESVLRSDVSEADFQRRYRELTRDNAMYQRMVKKAWAERCAARSGMIRTSKRVA